MLLLNYCRTRTYTSTKSFTCNNKLTFLLFTTCNGICNAFYNFFCLISFYSRLRRVFFITINGCNASFLFLFILLSNVFFKSLNRVFGKSSFLFAFHWNMNLPLDKLLFLSVTSEQKSIVEDEQQRV